MIYQRRSEPPLLLHYRTLYHRTNLPPEEKRYYYALEKGFQGEQKFDQLLKKLPDAWIILNDLALEQSNSTCQIDTLLIGNNNVFQIEVKNFEGDYFVNGDIWSAIEGNEIKNPLLQIKRSVSFVRGFLAKHGYSHKVHGYIVFIHPEFALYNAPIDSSIVLPSQINRFLKTFEEVSHYQKEKNLKLAELFKKESKKVKNALPRLRYKFDELKKGISCNNCYCLNTSLIKRKFVCEKCGTAEDTISAVVRNTKEFMLLFPEEKVTTNAIYEWIGGKLTKRSVQRILAKHFKIVRRGNYSYYVEDEVH